jgi:hypothetical protein
MRGKIEFLNYYENKKYKEAIAVLEANYHLIGYLTPQETAYLIIMLSKQAEPLLKECVELLRGAYTRNNVSNITSFSLGEEETITIIIKNIEVLLSDNVKITSELLATILLYPHQANEVVQGIRIVNQNIPCLSDKQIAALLLACGKEAKQAASKLVELNNTSWNIPFLSFTYNAKAFLNTFFKEAMLVNNLTIVRACLDTKMIPYSEIIEVDYVQYLPITLAAKLGSLSLVELLLSYGAPVDHALPESNKTPLMFAVQAGHTELVSKLIAHGANVNEAIKPEIEICAKTTMTSSKGERIIKRDNKTALILSVENGNIEIIELLLKAGANPNFRTETKTTALNRASCYENVNTACDMIKLLISYGAYISPVEYKDYALANQNSHYFILYTAHLAHLTALLKNNPEASKKEQLLHILKWYYHRLPCFSFFNSVRENLIAKLLKEADNIQNGLELSLIEKLKEVDVFLFQFVRDVILSEVKPMELHLFLLRSSPGFIQNKDLAPSINTTMAL